MKILIVSAVYFPEVGAAPSRITNMAEALRSRGVDVEVLTCMPNYPRGRIFDGYRGKLAMREEINGVKIHRRFCYATVSKNPILRALAMLSFSLGIFGAIFQIRWARSFDLVIVQTPHLLTALSAVMVFGKILRQKIALNLSDLWPLSAVELGALRAGTLLHKILCGIEKFLYKNAKISLCQSDEIRAHLDKFVPAIPKMVYRNLQRYETRSRERQKHAPLKIVYAGLLGVAQDILGLIQHVNFAELGAEFHIYGGGNQLEKIQKFLGGNDESCGNALGGNVFYHGFVSKEKIFEELAQYDISLIPLVTRIYGAVPSKIFDIVPMGMPIIFCGGGEGAEIVARLGLGKVCVPANYPEISQAIRDFVAMPADEFSAISKNCLAASRTEFDFSQQLSRLVDFLEKN